MCKCPRCRDWFDNVVYEVFYIVFLAYFTIRRRITKSGWEQWK